MFDLIAHRGASCEAPENTCASLQTALNIGVDYLEIDVHLTQDGIPVVIHDATLERTTNLKQPKRVVDMAFDALSTLDAGSWFKKEFKGEKIPSLSEVLSLERGDTGLMIEIKDHYPDVKALALSVAECLAKTSLSKITVGSFSIPILEELKRLLPFLPLIGIVEDLKMLPFMRKMKPPKMALWYKLLTPSVIQNLHNEGTEVWAFTVDTLKIAKFLISIGIDGIITNDPRSLKNLKDKKEQN